MSEWTCPNCGRAIKVEAKFCKFCGSDENTGWSEDTMYDDLGLPEEIEEPRRPSVIKHDLKVLLVVILITSFLYLSIRW